MLNQAELNRAKRLRVYKICRLQVHVYNCFKLYLQFNIVLLFAICLEVFIWWQNLTIFNKLKDEPWQQVTHAYYERWRLFMAL